MTLSLAHFPWARIMQFGFGTLKLAPETFWSLSVPELDAALRAYQGDPADRPVRDELERMMQQFPDTR